MCSFSLKYLCSLFLKYFFPRAVGVLPVLTLFVGVGHRLSAAVPGAWLRGFPWAVWGVGYCVPCLGFRLIAGGVLCVFPPQLSVCLLFMFLK